jgi:hypothetical protein
MKWLRLLSFTLGISVAAASVDFGLAGHLEIFREYGSGSYLVSPGLSLPYTSSEIISEPRYQDLSGSVQMLER